MSVANINCHKGHPLQEEKNRCWTHYKAISVSPYNLTETPIKETKE